MILIGTMNLTTTRDRGNFDCPNCGADQPYRLRARRPFLTLYFIPTVPVGPAELSVQCDQCRSTWDVSVLEMDRENHQMAMAHQFAEETLRACVLMTLVDGSISENEIDALLRISAHLLKPPMDRELMDREELGRLCSVAQQNQIECKNYVLTISKHWSEAQRLLAVQAMFLAATADSAMSDKKLQVLAEMREILKLTDADYQNAIESALALNLFV